MAVLLVRLFCGAGMSLMGWDTLRSSARSQQASSTFTAAFTLVHALHPLITLCLVTVAWPHAVLGHCPVVHVREALVRLQHAGAATCCAAG